jgi:hypothetical protein
MLFTKTFLLWENAKNVQLLLKSTTNVRAIPAYVQNVALATMGADAGVKRRRGVVVAMNVINN